MTLGRLLAAQRRSFASLVSSKAGSTALVGGLCVAVLGLLGLSYRSIEQWRRSDALLAEQRAEVMMTLLAASLSRDMRGAQVSVVLPLELVDIVQEPPYDLRDTFARALARFPYAESFFVWRSNPEGHGAAFDLFNRAGRPPSWDGCPAPVGIYPAVLCRDPIGASPLIEALRAGAASGHRFLIFDITLAGTDYQIVAKVISEPRAGVSYGVVGFAVNLQWVRQQYFSELVREVTRIGDADGFLSLAIEDDTGRAVVVTKPPAASGPVRQRVFSPLFFDSAMLPTLAPGRRDPRPWSAQVRMARERTLEAPLRGTYTMLAAAAVASVVGMLLTARAARSQANLATMQSDFVYGVTHELKTPLSLIRLMAETLGQRRYNSVETLSDYARLLSQEAWRLTRLIDNLLAYARLSNAPSGQRHVEPIEIAELMEDVLDHFRPQLAEKGFDLTVEVSPELPRIRGDRVMLQQALDNLVDNAIKYSPDRRALAVRAGVTPDGERLKLEIADRGVGIPAAEVPRVFDKFYRGCSVKAGGSGLGLAIVKRIVDENDGIVTIASAPDEGTTITLLLRMDK